MSLTAMVAQSFNIIQNAPIFPVPSSPAVTPIATPAPISSQAPYVLI